jgi:hypothetical protein
MERPGAFDARPLTGLGVFEDWSFHCLDRI